VYLEEPKPRVFTHGLGSSSKSFAFNRTNSIFPFYSYNTVSLEREETKMAFGNVDGAACGCGCDHGKGFGAGIAAVVIIILLLIAMGIVF